MTIDERKDDIKNLIQPITYLEEDIMASVFTKIIKGELPSYKIYENELIIAFLTIAPTQLGHTLIVPKTEVDHVLDVSEPEYTELFKS